MDFRVSVHRRKERNVLKRKERISWLSSDALFLTLYKFTI